MASVDFTYVHSRILQNAGFHWLKVREVQKKSNGLKEKKEMFSLLGTITIDWILSQNIKK